MVGGENAFDFLRRLSSELFERHRGHGWIQMLAPDCTEAPIPRDDNRDCWRIGFGKVLQKRGYETPAAFLLEKGTAWFGCESVEELRKLVAQDLGPRWHYDVPYIYELIQDSKRRSAN